MAFCHNGSDRHARNPSTQAATSLAGWTIVRTIRRPTIDQVLDLNPDGQRIEGLGQTASQVPNRGHLEMVVGREEYEWDG